MRAPGPPEGLRSIQGAHGTHLELVRFSRSDQLGDEEVGVEKVHVLIQEAVQNEQAVGPGREGGVCERVPASCSGAVRLHPPASSSPPHYRLLYKWKQEPAGWGLRGAQGQSRSWVRAGEGQSLNPKHATGRQAWKVLGWPCPVRSPPPHAST